MSSVYTVSEQEKIDIARPKLRDKTDIARPKLRAGYATRKSMTKLFKYFGKNTRELSLVVLGPNSSLCFRIRFC